LKHTRRTPIAVFFEPKRSFAWKQLPTTFGEKNLLFPVAPNFRPFVPTFRVRQPQIADSEVGKANKCFFFAHVDCSAVRHGTLGTPTSAGGGGRLDRAREARANAPRARATRSASGG
jgi:hypothetical protein